LFRTEQDIDDARNGPGGLFAEKHQLGNQKYRAVNGFLHFNQILDGAGFRFDKAAVKTPGAYKRQKGCSACKQFIAHISAFVGIRKRKMAQDMIQVKERYPENSRDRLPQKDLVSHADFRKTAPELLVPGMVKQVFEVTLVLGYINHDGVFGNFVKNSYLVTADGYAAIKKSEHPGRCKSLFARQEIAEVVLLSLEKRVFPGAYFICNFV